jgi:hypothetical protein
LKSLDQVIVKSFYKTNWHYYEIKETKVKGDDTVVDCGVAEGLFTFLISNRCKQVYT